MRIALILLLCCFGSITAQVHPDSTGSAVVIGKEVFRGIVQKLAERNSLQEDCTNLEKEVDIMDQEIVLKESLIAQLKQDNESLIKQLLKCEDRPGYDSFFGGAVGTLGVIIVGITIGLLVK